MIATSDVDDEVFHAEVPEYTWRRWLLNAGASAGNPYTELTSLSEKQEAILRTRLSDSLRLVTQHGDY